MGKITGFMEYSRKNNTTISPIERIKNYDEFYEYLNEKERREQGARCMDCGVPFCGSALELKGMVTGCPLHNLIPEWNDEVYNGNYSHGLARLLKTNPFPEFTGRVCPALCEKACINGMNNEAVTIKSNELFLIETGYAKGYIQAKPASTKSGKKVAVIGSGPAGLAAAEKLNKRGHDVTVFERDDKLGGLLMYGIPNMKLDKQVILRKIAIMEDEGVKFETNMDYGKNLDPEFVKENFDAIILSCGARNARDIDVPNRNSDGVYFAVDFLASTTKYLLDGTDYIDAKDKNVVIIGGGDTGNDCVGTSIRHGAKSVTQLEMMPMPSKERLASNPWPEWPKVLVTDYGQQESIAVFGKDPRVFQTTVKEICQENGKVVGVKTVQLAFIDGKLTEVENSEKYLEADLILIAAGFLGAESYMTEKDGTVLPTKNDTSYKTNTEKTFSCGDMKRGQSLVVWAIADGIKCAKEVDEFIMY